MNFQTSRSLILLTLVPFFSKDTAFAAEPTNSNGDAGLTSYLTLPFQSSVYNSSWGSSQGLIPMQLFFQSNANSAFYNASDMSQARGVAAGMESQGIIPSSGAQRWEDTYEASFPNGTFPNEPSWIISDRDNGNFPNIPEFVAWRNFITARPQYWDVAFDGGTMPAEPAYFRSWGGQYGHIDPGTPLDPVDYPPGMTNANYGDFYAYKWGLTAGLSGGYGVQLSDFSDSEPERTLNTHNFNSRFISNFAAMYPSTYPHGVPGSTVAAQAAYIVANDFNRWVDYHCTNYTKFFGAMATNLGAATSRIGLVEDQGGGNPSSRRLVALDGRTVAATMSPHSYLIIWDDQIIQEGRSGPLVNPPMTELGGGVLSAAREPLLRNGQNLESDDSAYWGAISTFYPSLSSSDQTEIGYKLLKRLWTWCSWAHIADRQGNVRRALCFMSRDYWDVGTLTALQPLTGLIQSIVPTRPYGVAVYYSQPLERVIEAQQGAAAGAGLYGPGNLYLAQTDLQTFLDSGTAAGYYVSDVALPKIIKGSSNAPSAWMVIDPTGQLSISEQNELSAIAPVVKTSSALAALSNKPINFTGGLAGFAFYDQNGRLIILVSNPSPQPTATAISGTIQLAGITNGTYAVSNLLAAGIANLSSGGVSNYTTVGGVLSVPVSVTRWDTLVYAVTAVSLTNTNSSPSPAQSQAPVLYWPFTATDSTGTNILNASGHGNIGWMLNPGANGTQIASTGGIFGGPCLTIASTAGSGGVIYGNNSPNSVSNLSAYPYSIAIWCKGANLDTIYSFSSSNSTGGYSEYRALNGPFYANALEDSTTSGLQNEEFETTNQSDGNWHHWCLTYNSPTSRSYYVDGQSAGGYSGAAGVTSVLDFFSVGCRELDPTNIHNVCAGYSLQDCAIWNMQLSPQTVAAVYALGYFGVAGAGTPAVTNFLNAYSNQTSVTINGTPWNYVTGLSGTVGTVTGTLAASTAAVDLDTAGGGMQAGAAVVPPGIAPTLSASISGTTVTINAVGTPGASYILQTATNVAGPWWPVSTNTAAAGTGALLLTDPNASNTTRFYRTLP